jgi:hypothetical protein
MLCKIWGCHCGDYEECRHLRFKPQFVPHKKHYVSATEPNQLMVYKIWGFNGCDYEEYRLLEYKNPILTSQEIHCVSATEPSQLMLCKIWGSHCGDYEECGHLGFKPQFVAHKKHYVSATEPNQLMVYKIWGFQGCDYEEPAYFRANFCGWKGVACSALQFPTAVNLSLLDWRRYFFFHVAPHPYEAE